MQVGRADVQTHIRAFLAGDGVVRYEFVFVRDEGDLIVVALENGRDNARGEDGSLVARGQDFEVLGTDYDIDGLVFLEALVHALEHRVGKFHLVVLEHYA